MKLSLMRDKEEDQNEIESKYLWNIHLFSVRPTMWRCNLSTLKIDSSFSFSVNNYWMRPAIILPNNHFLGIYLDTYHSLKCYFISDENFNIKSIETTRAEPLLRSYDFASCFYDNSIFTFESEFSTATQQCTARIAKRYFMSSKCWIQLCNFQFENFISCVGFNQQIVMIPKQNNWLLVYDISLDSYNNHQPIKNMGQSRVGQSDMKMIMKSKERLFLIIFIKCYKIYTTDDIYSDWVFVSNFKDEERNWHFDASACYRGSLHCLSWNYFNTFEFKLTNFQLKKVLELKYPNPHEEDKKIEILRVIIKT